MIAAHELAEVMRPPASRVLVVEDNADAAETMRMVLELGGYDAVLAFDGATGMAAARETRPRLVLSDIGLPGMDGYALARALRADPATAGVRLIAITGYGTAADRQRALEAGFDIHLVKPVPPERLLEEVAAALRDDTESS